MLYNSYIFIFLFLPITLLGFHFLRRKGHYRLTISWLIAASLFFYGWWNPIYLGLLVGSALFNYAFGFVLLNRPSKLLLFLGIIGNLGALGYFKYGNFFVDNINVLFNNSYAFLKFWERRLSPCKFQRSISALWVGGCLPNHEFGSLESQVEASGEVSSR